MQKIKTSRSVTMRRWISVRNKDFYILATDGKQISCLVCRKEITGRKKSHVDSYYNSDTYIFEYINTLKILRDCNK